LLTSFNTSDLAGFASVYAAVDNDDQDHLTTITELGTSIGSQNERRAAIGANAALTPMSHANRRG
jgi:hypothetical protein